MRRRGEASKQLWVSRRAREVTLDNNHLIAEFLLSRLHAEHVLLAELLASVQLLEPDELAVEGLLLFRETAE